MRRTTWRLLSVGLAAVTAAAVAPLVFAAEDRAAAKPNNDPGFVQVYDNNVENLPATGDKCPGDWQDLMYYMQDQTYKPDLFIVQQVSGAGHPSKRGDLDYLVARMSKDFGEAYGGVIADATPGPGPQRCAPQKGYQTNAIVYRKARFSVAKTSHNTWRAQSEQNGGCANSPQPRTTGVKALLHDKIADKNLTAASAHWPTAASDGPPCAGSNAKETSTEMTEDGYGADLTVLGGDMNYTYAGTNGGTNYRSWYRSMNGDLKGAYGFRDPVFAACASASGPAKCVGDNWTIHGDRRIDFLFTRKGSAMPKVDAVHTITFNEGDAADKEHTGSDNASVGYSDHRAIRARIHY